MLDRLDPSTKVALLFGGILAFFVYGAPLVSFALGWKAVYAMVASALVFWLAYRFATLLRDR